MRLDALCDIFKDSYELDIEEIFSLSRPRAQARAQHLLVCY